MERAYAVLFGEEPDEGFAALAAELARLHFFLGDFELAQERCEAALEVAERLWLPETLSQALNTMGLIVAAPGGWERGFAHMKHALELALENDLPGAALRAYNNAGDMLDRRDRYEEAIALHQRGIALARKVGDRAQEWRLLSEYGFCLMRTGRWAEASAVLETIPSESSASQIGSLIDLAALRGDAEDARAKLELVEYAKDAADLQDRTGYELAESVVLRAEGAHEQALAAAERAIEAGHEYSMAQITLVKLAVVEALRAAFACGRHDRVRELLVDIEGLKPGEQPPMLRAHAARFRALLGEEPEQRFKSAAALFREYGMTFEAAVVQLEQGEWLASVGRSEEAGPLLDEAREMFEQIGAAQWLERAGSAVGFAAVAP
jgi:tetratricopeptide (TPR) repeat protein